MQQVSLYVALAEIAGVFVGFGALITFTRGSKVDALEFGTMRGTVTAGLETMVAALIPVGIAAYGASGHSLWVLCAVGYLIVDLAILVDMVRRPDNRAFLAAAAHSKSSTFWFYWLGMQALPLWLPLLIIVLGLLPGQEPALYTTAVLFNLFQAAFTLWQVVYMQVCPPPEPIAVDEQATAPED